MFQQPTWIVQYATRRPSIRNGLTAADRGEVEVSGTDRDSAAAAFRQMFPVNYRIEAIFMRSATGFA